MEKSMKGINIYLLKTYSLLFEINDFVLEEVHVFLNIQDAINWERKLQERFQEQFRKGYHKTEIEQSVLY